MTSAEDRPEQLSSRFRRLREGAGLTKTALAADRYTVSYVSQIESGRRRPSSGALAFFAQRLGVSEGFLGTGIPDGLESEIAYELEEARRALRGGRPQEAHDLLRPLLDRTRQYGLTQLCATATALDAYALVWMGRVREGIDRYEEALEEGLGERERGMATAALGHAYRTVGDLTYGAELVESYLRAHRLGPLDPTVSAELHAVLVSIYFERGDVVAAERAARRALAAADEGVSAEVRANVLWDASRVLAEAKRWDKALEMATRARIIIESLSDQRRLARVHNAYAFLCLETDPPRLEEAATHLDVAESVLGASAVPEELAYLYLERGRLALLLERAEEALSYSERALVRTGDDELQRGRGLFLRGRALSKLGRPWAALESFEEAAAAFQKLGARQQEASCWREVGEIQLESGDTEAAVGSLRAGLEALDPRRSRA